MNFSVPLLHQVIIEGLASLPLTVTFPPWVSLTDPPTKFKHSNLPGSRSILSVSIWIRLASSSATASSCQSWLCPTQNKGWENPPADLDEGTQVPLQWKVLAVVAMIATMLQWRVSYRSNSKLLVEYCAVSTHFNNEYMMNNKQQTTYPCGLRHHLAPVSLTDSVKIPRLLWIHNFR